MPTVSPESVRVLLVDDHEVVRAGLRMLIESRPGLTVVGEAANRSDALAAAAREQPHLILLDLDLGDSNGVDFLPDLLTAAAGARVLILTGVRDSEQHRRAVLAGAMGVVVKEKAAEVLIQAIEKVHAGEVWLERSMMASVLDGMMRVGEVKPEDPELAKIATLTEREREVIALIGHGLKNKHIGDRLFISETTVRHHLTAIFNKLSVADRLELLVYAYRHGLTELPR